MLQLKPNNKQKGKYLDYVLKKDNFIGIYTLQLVLTQGLLKVQWSTYLYENSKIIKMSCKVIKVDRIRGFI